MKQIEVQVMQQTYVLACPPGQEAKLLESVALVDSAMTRIRDAGKVRARERIAVLAALNLAFELSDRTSAIPAPQTTAPTDDESSATQERMQQLLNRLDTALQG